MNKKYEKPAMIVTSYVTMDTTSVTLLTSQIIAPNHATSSTFKNFKINS